MKLEDLPKKNVFKAPEGYFDKLPGILQSRIAEKETKPSREASFGWVLRYALPLLVVGIALVLIFRQPDANPEELLATVSAEELTAYLVESDLSTEELLDFVVLDEYDIDALNDYQLDTDVDSDLLEEYANEIEL